MNIDLATATTIAGISGAIGAIVAGGVSALNTWFIRRSEERRQIRELAVRVAIEEWKHHAELAEKHQKTTRPLDLYLIHSMYFVRSLDGSLRTKEQISDHLRRAQAITDAAYEEIKDYSKK